VLAVKPMTPFLLRTFGFRNVLLLNGPVVAVTFAMLGLFSEATPFIVIAVFLAASGFVRSFQFSILSALGFAEITSQQMSQATSLSAVGVQLSISSGVALGALTVEAAMRFHGHTAVAAADFPPAFLAIALVTLSSTLIVLGLPNDAGAELANRKPAAPAMAEQEPAQEFIEKRKAS
jgi:hypothetical protein